MSEPFAELTDQVAIITGGAKGIGKGCADLLAASGVRVVVADVDAEAGRLTARQINDAGGTAIFSLTDVGETDQIRGLIIDTVAQFGRLDVVVNNAYWSVRKSAIDLAEEEWDRGMNVMLKAAYLFAKYGFPEMQNVGKGSMVNIASVHGLAAVRNYPVYAAAKAGLINLTRQMSIDAGPLGIRVNAICPGWIRTRDAVSYDQDWAKKMERLYPVGRAGLPVDIANAVRFLVSDQASFITGHALVVDGGLTTQLPDSFVV